jgi:hypothetical protein
VSFLAKFQSTRSRDGLCTSQKGLSMRNDLGPSKSWECVQGWQTEWGFGQPMITKICMQSAC